MIGLAVLEYVASKTGLVIDDTAFYEQLPIDYATGNLFQYGVFVTTEAGAMAQGSDYHNFINIYVAIGEGAGYAEKYETDRVLDLIQDVVVGALSDENSWGLNTHGFTYTDVRILPSSSKVRGVTLANGAIVKALSAEIYYKKRS